MAFLLASISSAKIYLSDPAFKPNASLDYLIITPAEEGIITECKRLARFKTERGLQTRIVRTDSIQAACAGRDIQEKIRTCIQDAYFTSGVTWVLLAGDFALIPARTVYTGELETTPILSDIYYSCLDGTWDNNNDGRFGDDSGIITFRLQCRYDSAGTYVCDRVKEDTVGGIDLWSDVYIGRIPVSSGDEARIVIDKIIAYSTRAEQTSAAQDIFMFGTKLFDEDSVWKVDDTHAFLHYELKPVFSNPTPAFSQPQFTEAYEDSMAPDGSVIKDSTEITKEMLVSGFSSGPNLVIFAAHGSDHDIMMCSFRFSAFDNADVLALQSATYSTIITLSCDLMQYHPDSATCFAKNFLVNPNGGAVSFCGYSEIEYLDYGEQVSIAAVGSLASGKTTRIAVAFQNGELGQRRTELYAHQYWGDPEMELWTKRLSPADTIALSICKSSGRYLVSTSPALDSALVCLYRPGAAFARGYTRAGKVELDTACFGADSFTITWTKHNFLPGRLVLRPSDVPEVGVRFAASAPAAGRLRVYARAGTVWFENGNVQKAEIRIFDIHGRLAHARSIAGSTAAGVQGLPAGMYVIRIDQSGHRAAQTLLLCK